ncbi:MAG: metallophosphoesterase [Oscillospiraceae bacterium]|jgi:UDP-2,3-diacylglucosamine pyrophosphatase LpxH
MAWYNRVSKLYQSSREIDFDEDSRIVIMSDCHRGDGSFADSFAKNRNLFTAALYYYYVNNYTYIELGDGDELWENRRISEIVSTYPEIFQLMSRFHKDNRLYMMLGNHDYVKRKEAFIKKRFEKHKDALSGKIITLFPNIKVYEGLLLRYACTDNRIFLMHGQQADFLNGPAWKLTRFMVRYLWKPLEILGVNDPTSAAKSSKRKLNVEKKLMHWAKKENQILIAGHTHRYAYPKPGDSPYFNDGCCVTGSFITAMEIRNGCITLVKWSFKTRADGTVYVGRDVLAGPRKLKRYFSLLEKKPYENMFSPAAL